MGTLHWATDSGREGSMNLKQVVEVTLGKLHPIFKKRPAANATSSCVITIKAKRQPELHLEAPSVVEALAWTTALSFLLKKYRQILLKEDVEVEEPKAQQPEHIPEFEDEDELEVEQIPVFSIARKYAILPKPKIKENKL